MFHAASNDSTSEWRSSTDSSLSTVRTTPSSPSSRDVTRLVRSASVENENHAQYVLHR
jgi:hypothetical protein